MLTQRRRGACQLLVILLLLFRSGQQYPQTRPLLVFLIDGFRYDYLDDLDALPGFRELVVSGVKVDYMTPDFPSLSYPNYYTLMTGNSLTFSVWLPLWGKNSLNMHWKHKKPCLLHSSDFFLLTCQSCYQTYSKEVTVFPCFFDITVLLGRIAVFTI